MERFDLTLNQMEETRFLKKNQDLALNLSKTVHFSCNEVETLLIMYYKIQKFDTFDPKGITRDELMEICHCCLDMTNTNMVIRVLACLDETAKELHVSKEFFVKAMSLLLRGTLEEKMALCFKVYDQTGCGMLGKEQMFRLLRDSIKSNTNDAEAEESVKDMVEVILKKVDRDRDGKISFNDYRYTVLRQPELLEFLGQCLPTRHSVHKFLLSFTSNTRIRYRKLKQVSIM